MLLKKHLSIILILLKQIITLCCHYNHVNRERYICIYKPEFLKINVYFGWCKKFLKAGFQIIISPNIAINKFTYF